jgi:hypothetical protein
MTFKMLLKEGNTALQTVKISQQDMSLPEVETLAKTGVNVYKMHSNG